jgi:hypothetical protein
MTLCATHHPMQTGSHVHDIVRCLQFVRESRENKTPAEEVLHEMEVRLCELMHQMITSPLTGKMFAVQPQEQVTEQEALASLKAQTTV